MTERPILFSGPMVRAILTCARCGNISVPFPCEHCGSTEFVKTNTRRAMKYEDFHGCLTGDCPHQKQSECDACLAEYAQTECPHGVPGDRLWVRETCIIAPKFFSDRSDATCYDGEDMPRIVQYLATSPNRDAANDYKLKATPSIFMPRWASRITLEIADVRVQRLQEINESDAEAEGAMVWWNTLPRRTQEFIYNGGRGPLAAFQMLWDSINAKRGFGWDTNPWVWALTFKRVEVPAC